MKELNYVYVGKAKDFNLWKVLLYSIRHSKSFINEDELLTDQKLLKLL